MSFIPYLRCLVVPTKPLVSDSLFARFYRDFRYYDYSTLARIMSGDYEAVDECGSNFDPDWENSDDSNLNPWWVNSGYYRSYWLTSQPFYGYRYISIISATGTIVVICFCRCCHSLVQVVVSAILSRITSILFYAADGLEGGFALPHSANHSSGLYSTGGAPGQMESLLRNLE